MKRSIVSKIGLLILGTAFFTVGAETLSAQGSAVPDTRNAGRAQPRAESVQEYNSRLEALSRMVLASDSKPLAQDYLLGPDDLLDISVFEAPELKRTVRLSARGEITLPLIGAVRAAGLTVGELEAVIEELLRRTYMKDPHVAVFLQEMQSHPVSVLGAVNKPGVFQIRGAKTIVEVLSMANGLAEDAGNTVIVIRHAEAASAEATTSEELKPVAANESQGKVDDTESQSLGSMSEQTVEVNLKGLLDTGDSQYNVMVYPGDLVKVPRAGVVYVVGGVRKPGGFTFKANQNISVLQVLALAEGLTSTAGKSRARIIRTAELSGARTEIPVNLGKILAGKAADPMLQAKDIVFVPNSPGKAALYRGAETSVGIVSGLAVYRW